MKRAVWIAAVAAAMLSFGLASAASAEMRSVTLGVGMYCPSCSYMVQRALNAVPGVLRLRDPREWTSSLKQGEEEAPLWTYLESLLRGLEPKSP